MPGKSTDYIDWDEYFMSVAFLSSLRSKDPKTQVGACIVNDNRILATGYNGATRGFNDDLFPWNSTGEITGDILKIKNTFVVHAEANAIDNFNGYKRDLKGSTLYVTLFPCPECAKKIVQNGISKVIYARMYSDQNQVKASHIIFHHANVEVCQYKDGADKEEVVSYQSKLKKLVKNFSSSKN